MRVMDLPVGPMGEGGGGPKVLSTIVAHVSYLIQYCFLLSLLTSSLLSNTEGIGLGRNLKSIQMTA